LTKKELEAVFLDYSIEPYEMDKELGDDQACPYKSKLLRVGSLW
jgi:hypothetical protein